MYNVICVCNYMYSCVISKGKLSENLVDLRTFLLAEKWVWLNSFTSILPGGGGGAGVLPNMGYIGICRGEGYGFQAGYSRIGYIKQSVWV